LPEFRQKENVENFLKKVVKLSQIIKYESPTTAFQSMILIEKRCEILGK